MKTIETGARIDDLGMSEETLAAIILKAKTFDAVVAESDPMESSNGSDDRFIDILEDQADNPAREVLEAAITGLDPDQRETLVALTWLGRGDFETAEWEDAKQTAAERNNGEVARYLSGIPMLGNFLETGAAALGISVTSAETALMSHDQNPDPKWAHS